jgi:hypothetical protein
MKVLKIVLVVLLLGFISIQFFGIEKSNPEFDSQLDFLTIENPPENIEKIFRNACYDCHSNETQWPWYANVAPMSWMIEDHVEEGRDYINLNDWGDYELEDRHYILEEMMEEIDHEEMPLPAYRIFHRDSRITDIQKAELFEWIRSVQKSAE